MCLTQRFMIATAMMCVKHTEIIKIMSVLLSYWKWIHLAFWQIWCIKDYWFWFPSTPLFKQYIELSVVYWQTEGTRNDLLTKAGAVLLPGCILRDGSTLSVIASVYFYSGPLDITPFVINDAGRGHIAPISVAACVVD